LVRRKGNQATHHPRDHSHPHQIVTKEGEEQYLDAVITGGLKGFAYATALGVPGYFLLTRNSATYRALPPSLKAFGFVVIGIPLVSVCAEKSGERFEQSQWTGVGKVELDKEAERERRRLEQLSLSERVKDFGKRNQYGIVGGS
jgi:hypothetical protein